MTEDLIEKMLENSPTDLQMVNMYVHDVQLSWRAKGLRKVDDKLYNREYKHNSPTGKWLPTQAVADYVKTWYGSTEGKYSEILRRLECIPNDDISFTEVTPPTVVPISFNDFKVETKNLTSTAFFKPGLKFIICSRGYEMDEMMSTIKRMCRKRIIGEADDIREFIKDPATKPVEAIYLFKWYERRDISRIIELQKRHGYTFIFFGADMHVIDPIARANMTHFLLSRPQWIGSRNPTESLKKFALYYGDELEACSTIFSDEERMKMIGTLIDVTCRNNYHLLYTANDSFMRVTLK